MIVNSFNSSTGKQRLEELRIPGQPGLHNEFQDCQTELVTPFLRKKARREERDGER